MGKELVRIDDLHFRERVIETTRAAILEYSAGDRLVSFVHDQSRRFFACLQQVRQRQPASTQWPCKATVIGAMDEDELPCSRALEHQPKDLSKSVSFLWLNSLYCDPPTSTSKYHDIDYVVSPAQFLSHLQNPYPELERVLHQRRSQGRLHPDCQKTEDYEMIHVGWMNSGMVALALGWEHAWFVPKRRGGFIQQDLADRGINQSMV